MTRLYDDYEFEEDPAFEEPNLEELVISKRRQELEPDLIYLADQMILAYESLRPQAVEIESGPTIDTKEWGELSSEPEFPLRFRKGRHLLLGHVIGGFLTARLGNNHELVFINCEEPSDAIPRWQFSSSRIITPGQAERIKVLQRYEPRPQPDNTTMEITVETLRQNEAAVWGDTTIDELLCGPGDHYSAAETYIDALHKDKNRALEEFV